MKHERVKAAAWWVVIGLTVLFIWGQTLLRREQSCLQSGAVLRGCSAAANKN